MNQIAPHRGIGGLRQEQQHLHRLVHPHERHRRIGLSLRKLFLGIVVRIGRQRAVDLAGQQGQNFSRCSLTFG